MSSTDSTRVYDVICLGRAAVDLYGDQLGGRLEDMQSFSKYLGGSAGNLAVGLARLGTRSSMLTRVGDEHMGRFVRETLNREGVDVGHVLTDPQRLTGLVVLGISDRDSFPHLFFRERCADMGLEPGDFDAAYISSARALAITGTQLSSEQGHGAVSRAVALAREHGTRVVLDVDYRPVLWGLTAHGEGQERYVDSPRVSERIQALLPDCDLVVGTEEEIHIAGGDPDSLAALRNIRSLSRAVIVLKRGPLGCSVFEGAIPDSLDGGVSVTGVQVEVLNVLGAGDAFLAGFLDAWLRGAEWKDCARQANACGALVVSRHGCSPAMPSRVELDAFLFRAAETPRPDRDDALAHLHAATTRGEAPEELMVLAFDHRRQLEELVVSTEPPGEKIARFKSLVGDAVERVAQGRGRHGLGVIVDERYGENVLARLASRQWWIGRPVEVPASRPLAFDPREHIGLPLLAWPATQVVKCLVFYHPGDELDLRLQQEHAVQQLYHDCVALGRELLLEVIASTCGPECDEHTMANILRRFYNLGVRPAWWKLEPQSRLGWQEVSSVIEAHDPHCRGVLLLGLDAPREALQASFRTAAEFPVCRGFAVGRSIFGDSARAWFAGEIEDAEVVVRVADNYERMIQDWREARAVGRAGTDRREGSPASPKTVESEGV